jgi:hypothetical protein
MKTTAYCKSNDGLVHLQSTANPEFTLCGDAFDCGDISGSNDEEKSANWIQCAKGPVTCPLCVAQIEACRGVRTKTLTIIQRKD